MHLWTNYILTRSNADDDDDAIDAIRPVTVQRNYPSDRVFFFISRWTRVIDRVFRANFGAHSPSLLSIYLSFCLFPCVMHTVDYGL